jgi:DNA polymerase-3 subunit delta'
MKFNDIICANAQIKGLENSIYTDTVIQSLIIEGQLGTGKKTLVNIYANALVCLQEQNKPCGACKGCKLFLSGNHPDIIEVRRNNKKSIGVDEIKSLQKEAIIKPNESNRKIFIIHDAHTMTAQAQNALLKLVEEPQKYLSIILICENTMALLETIISRCSIVPMPYLSYDNIIKGLIKKGIEQKHGKIIAQGVNGSLGKALDRYSDSAYIQRREEYIDIFFMLFDNKTKAYENASQKRDSAKEMICLWQSLARDALLHKNTEIDNIENIDKISRIDAFSNAYSREELIGKLEALCDAEKRLYYNSQYKLVLDNLMTKI